MIVECLIEGASNALLQFDPRVEYVFGTNVPLPISECKLVAMIIPEFSPHLIYGGFRIQYRAVKVENNGGSCHTESMSSSAHTAVAHEWLIVVVSAVFTPRPRRRA